MADVKEITKKLEDGVKEVFESDRYKEYLDFMGRFYNYSAGNIILILMQKPDASLVAGFQAWQKKFNRHVRKGEKGITILAPSPRKFKTEVEKEDGTTEEKVIAYVSFHPTTVFDISQTEGEEIPSVVRKLDGEVEGYEDLIGKLENLASVPVVFQKVEGTANGYFSQAENRIVVDEGMSEAQTVKTLIHEIAHSILHSGAGAEADRETKEVQAESVAYVVCNLLGIDTSDYSFGYVAGWSKDRGAKELMASTEVIRKTAIEIAEGLGVA